MSTRLSVGIAALVCMVTCGVLSALYNSEMLEKVSGKVPNGRSFSPLGWHFPKTLQLHREYGRLYPSGPLLRKVRVAIFLGAVSLVVCAWTLGFFP